MTIFWTILSGVVVYILGQLTIRFVVEPMQAQRETIGSIINFLIYHANRFTSPGVHPLTDDPFHVQKKEEKLRETQEAARVLASELMVKSQAIPFYSFWERRGLLKNRNNIREAQRQLFFISNNMFQHDPAAGDANYRATKAIEDALGIATEYQIEEPAAPNGE